MSRIPKKTAKNVNVSVSITNEQKSYIENNPKFNVSQFLQMHLQEYIELDKEIKRRIKL
jgi:hypothetical protein